MADMFFSRISEAVLNEPGEREFAEGLWQMAENCRDARAHLAAEAEENLSEAMKLIPNADSENIVSSIIDRDPDRCSVHMARLAVLKLVQAKEFFVNARIVSDHELKLYAQLGRCACDKNGEMLVERVRRTEEDRQGYICAIRGINDVGDNLPVAKLGLNSVWRE